MNYMLEACVDSVASAAAAKRGGADRLELCANLVIGGTTPGEALFSHVKEETGLPVRVLMRPRFGDFCYDAWEFQMLLEEVRQFRRLGAEGIVIGMLKPDGGLDVERIKALMEEAEGMKVTLHRAFDVCCNPIEALEQCIELGIDTILTSGQKASALEGRELLARLAEEGEGRIEIMAGAGIGSETIRELASSTKVRAYHMSGKIVKDSAMEFRRPGVPMGLPGISEYEIWQTSEQLIREAAWALREISGENNLPLP